PHATLHAAAVHLGGSPLTRARLPALVAPTGPAPGSAIEVRLDWPDGARDTVRLPAPDADHPTPHATENR
ncbi:hypothetical protein, partial [Streptomyces hainanensis]|uniref:hypothetical protein n=1 Tax=Streptomyces hainanensis TaxID=402648 RepID=UPI001A9E49B6